MPALESLPSEPARLIEVRRRRSTQIMVLVAILCVIVPFLFWRGTWFGRPLSEGEIGQYLSDTERPRHIQHALVQIGERMARGDPAVERWYPQMVGLAASPYSEIRVTLAWVMGGDTRSGEFHRALNGLLQDPDPLVRRNAALALVRFSDASGKPELLNMLRPYAVRAPKDGSLRYRVRQDDSVDSGTVVAEIATGEQNGFEIRSPLPGRVQNRLAGEGSRVTAGQEILILSPGSEHIWEALRALYLVGGAEDLTEVERFANGSIGELPAKIRQQAKLTAGEIRRRGSEPRQVSTTP